MAFRTYGMVSTVGERPITIGTEVPYTEENPVKLNESYGLKMVIRVLAV
jgi:hypothetical protein